MRVIVGLLVMAIALLSGCASLPPKHQENLCTIFDQCPEWYDAATESQNRWGTPPHILMAFVKQESSFRHDATPPWDWFLFIPLGRQSSAEGYAQAKDETWEEYEDETDGFFQSRSTMEDALDFIGWYNDKSSKDLGISKWDPRRLYLAYHEGRSGYARGSYKRKPRSCASPIVWIGWPGSTARSCVNANIGSSVGTGISSGHSAAETPASNHGKEFNLNF